MRSRRTHIPRVRYIRAMSMMRTSVLVLPLALLACGYPKTAAVPGPLAPTAVESAAARWPGTTAESLNAGRELFVAKCNDCHGHPDIKRIADDRWPGILERMGKKADLTPEQTETVLRFVLTTRVDLAAK